MGISEEEEFEADLLLSLVSLFFLEMLSWIGLRVAGLLLEVIERRSGFELVFLADSAKICWKIYCTFYNNVEDCPHEDKRIFLHEDSPVCRFGKGCEMNN